MKGLDEIIKELEALGYTKEELNRMSPQEVCDLASLELNYYITEIF